MFGTFKKWLGKRRTSQVPDSIAPNDVDQFAELLACSGLQNVRQTMDCVELFRAEKVTSEDIPAFCRFLIATRRVTEWQCEKLKKGQWKGFYLDNYLLLEQVGKGHDYSSYKCRDMTSGAVVCMVVTPLRLTGGQIVYRIEPFLEGEAIDSLRVNDSGHA